MFLRFPFGTTLYSPLQTFDFPAQSIGPQHLLAQVNNPTTTKEKSEQLSGELSLPGAVPGPSNVNILYSEVQI